MNHLDQLPDPCAGLCPIKETMQHSARVSLADITLIKNICPEKGLFTRMSQLFYHSIAEELRELNITHYTPENVELIITIIKDRLVSRRLPNSQPS